MKKRVSRIRLVLVGLVVSLMILALAGAAGGQSTEPPTQEDVKAAIEEGVAWLAGQQEIEGYWPTIPPEGWWSPCGYTGLAVKKLEHHAVDIKWGYGLDSPFDDAYPYKENVVKGLNWLFANCAYTSTISEQPAGNPDTDGDYLGVYFQEWWGDGYQTYVSGIALMTICEAVELDRVVESGPLAGWTYEEVARDMMDYLAFSQNDADWQRGGWGYHEGLHDFNGEPVMWSDQSNAGYAALGLGFAEAAPPQGCGFTVPQFVKDELNLWVDYIQNDVEPGPDDPDCDASPLGLGDCDGGAGYVDPDSWVSILKTGNLLQQMALLGDTAETPRVQHALDYLARHWYDEDPDPGWRGLPLPDGKAGYQATFTTMKGLVSLGLFHEFGDPPIEWQADFETVLLGRQDDDGSWLKCWWGGGEEGGEDPILCTTWALLTLEKAAPPPSVPVDIHPESCPNPLKVNAEGVLPVAILGTGTFDVTLVDPASVELEGVAPLRWALENVATPFEPFIGKEDAYDCTEQGPDGYLDLTLKYEAQELITALGDVEDGDVLVLHLTGNLKDEFGGNPFEGEDVVVILKKQ